MSETLAARPARARCASVVDTLEALVRETRDAFEALARRRYDAPWQRISQPRAGGR